ncbi:unnamed protein product [Protopolystoma xenopodis]|uniref:Uncharacterized protein n=1 Tax=Protopolystoma xenopodis TaxID=117903 RepID=A0A448WLC1_9PLAT|nr:unnamed protein product [Protopolystoma xenopodis]
MFQVHGKHLAPRELRLLFSTAAAVYVKNEVRNFAIQPDSAQPNSWDLVVSMPSNAGVPPKTSDAPAEKFEYVACRVTYSPKDNKKLQVTLMPWTPPEKVARRGKDEIIPPNQEGTESSVLPCWLADQTDVTSLLVELDDNFSLADKVLSQSVDGHEVRAPFKRKSIN